MTTAHDVYTATVRNTLQLEADNALLRAEVERLHARLSRLDTAYYMRQEERNLWLLGALEALQLDLAKAQADLAKAQADQAQALPRP